MTQTAFIIIALSSLLLLYYGSGKNKKRLLLFTVWQLLTGLLALFGVFEKHPGSFPLLIAGTFVITFILLKQINTQTLNLKALLSIHILRLPVELALYQLFLQKKIPYLMTFKGWNFDILIGISALVIFSYCLFHPIINRRFFIAWNIIGLVFLFIIVSLAILSSPLPIQKFAFEQPNIAVLEFPYCFLPSCIVPIVLISHVLLIGQYKKSQY